MLYRNHQRNHLVPNKLCLIRFLLLDIQQSLLYLEYYFLLNNLLPIKLLQQLLSQVIDVHIHDLFLFLQLAYILLYHIPDLILIENHIQLKCILQGFHFHILQQTQYPYLQYFLPPQSLHFLNMIP